MNDMASGCIVGFLMLILSVLNRAVTIPPPRWPPHSYKIALDANVFLFWTPNGSEIIFEIQAPTKGWIGLGLGTGDGMAGADIVVGWFKDGKGTLQDMYADGNKAPVLDDKQDWKLLNAEETNTFTALRFSRLLDTGDCSNDRAITADTAHIIWAYHQSDQLQYHGTSKGQMSLHLLDSPQPSQPIDMPSNVMTFDLIMPNVTIPANKSTLYWCQVLAIPKLSKKHHIIKYSVIVDNPRIAHHIIAYGCYQPITNASMLNTGYECYTRSMPEELYGCREATLGWAVGGDDTVHMPPEAGIPVGTRDDIQFFMLEMHYNNVEKKDWIDHSGLRVWYTPTLRSYDAGVLTTGSLESEMQIIPPKSIFTSYGICSEECTRKYITVAEGIHVYAYWLHSHLLGRRIRVRHIRNGNQIGWLGKDEHYNFNYQQIRQFSTEKRILPGDKVIVECEYDSSERELNTYGGLSTEEEMCLVFFSYYPRMKMSGCYSAVLPQNHVGIFNASVVVADNMTVMNPANYRGKPFRSIFDNALWNDRLVRDLQQVQTTQQHLSVCGIFNYSASRSEMETTKYPSFTALNVHEGNCKGRLNGLQSATSEPPVQKMANSSWIPTTGASVFTLWLIAIVVFILPI